MSQYVFHLIGTAHIDPVWLWDYREGFNEGLITCRAILDIMDEDPEITFSRGEAAIYEHIEKTDPELFARILHYIKLGRWETLGGTFIQSDENLPDTETLIRQYLRGQQSFNHHFGRPAVTGWSADCFGHTAGMPAILNAAGLKQFAFTRPLKPECTLPGVIFWWDGPGQSRVLACRPLCDWYCIERDGMLPRLNQVLTEASTQPLTNIVVMYGLGNHGGGPTRRHIQEIRQWAKEHPKVTCTFSTYERFFESVFSEIKDKPADFLPTFRGEVQYCERGCHTSMAKLKFKHRLAQYQLQRAETTDALIAAKLDRPAGDLARAWDSVLFNSFHDILPGTSIERAADMQIAHIGEAVTQADRVEFAALNALARQIDTRITPAPGPDLPTGVALLAWNPLPVPFTGMVELEVNLDWRPIYKYTHRPDKVPIRVLDSHGVPMPYQSIPTECFILPHAPLRKRVLVPLSLPAAGWSVVEMSYREDCPNPADQMTPEAFFNYDGIENGIFQIDTYVGARSIRIRRKGSPLLGGEGLAAAIFDDPWGSWGGSEQDPQSNSAMPIKEHWTVADVRVLSEGPLRASLWVRLAGARSHLDLTFSLDAHRDAVDISARVFWNERLARLKLLFPGGDNAEFEVPAGSVMRNPCGSTPASRWVRLRRDDGTSVGIVTDSLSGFDARDGILAATVVRSSRYAYSSKVVEDHPWRPTADVGELKFRMVLTTGDADLPHLAQQLVQPPVILPVLAQAGSLPPEGSLLQVDSHLRVLAFKAAQDGRGWILRLQETGGLAATETKIILLERPAELGLMPPCSIRTFRLTPSTSGWHVEPATAIELPGS